MRINFIFRTVFLLVVGFCTACSGSDAERRSLSEETLENVARVLWMSEYDSSRISEEVRQRLLSDVNSEAAFGQRMQSRLDDLISNQDSCSPDYTTRYEEFKKYSNTMSAHQAYAATVLLGKDSSRGYQEVPPEVQFSFPQDDSPQNKYQVGWHFFVGSAFSDSGEEYGAASPLLQ